MKKIICMFLTVLMIAGTVSVYASSDVKLDFLKPDFENSYEKTTVVKINSDYNFEDSSFSENEILPIDYAGLFGGFVSSEISSNVKQVAKKNAISIQADFNVNLPVNINSKLKADTYFGFDSWIDIDYSDSNDIKTKIVRKTPLDIRYQISEIPDDDIYFLYSIMPSSPFSETFCDEYIKLISSNSTVSKWSNRVKIKMSNEQLYTLLNNAVDMCELLDIKIPGIDYITDENIFDSDALSCEYTLDSHGRILSTDTTVNFDFTDIADGENIKLCVNEKSNYKYTVPKIDYPILTDENSYVVSDEDEEFTDDYDDYDDYEWYYNYCNINFSDDNIFEDYINTDYIPLRYVFDDFSYKGNSDFNISPKYGKIHITSDKNFDLTLTEFSNEVIFNGQLITLDNPVIESDGICFVNNEFLEKVFGLNYNLASKYYNSDKTNSYSVYFD